MKLPTIQTNAARVIALIAGLFLATSSKATVPTSDLPDFDNLPNFAQLGNNLDQNDSDVFGNVGVSEGGAINIGAPSTINGDLFLATGATSSGSGAVTGTTFTGQDLATEQSTVFSVSAALATLTPDQTVSGDQTAGLSFDVPAGEVYVLNLDGGLNLNDQDITLTGDGSLVLNIGGSFTLNGSASILGNARNIFVNYLGSGTVGTSVGNTINGQVFIPNAPGTLAGVWNGGLYSGNQQISLLSAAVLNAIPVPEPVVPMLAGLGGFSMILLRRRPGALKNSI